MMGRMLQLNPRYRHKKIIPLFANTGKELQETLDFVKQCDDYFGWDTVWLEAVIDPEKGKGTRHKVVNYETAKREHEYGPFDDFIKKYDVPNPCKPHGCTRELKIKPMENYMKSLGYKKSDYVSAIGIRADEPRRIKMDVDKIYPLFDYDLNELAVRQFWKKQPFDLQLKTYQGNCRFCYHKSHKKQVTLMRETPDHLSQWWVDREAESPRNFVFTRGYHRMEDMRELAKTNPEDFPWAEDRFDNMDVMAEPLAYSHDKIFGKRKRNTA